ncbi:FAD-dependent monooxygenase [Streptomyces sp. NPDC001787]|uniref:FAD-dependent monooxygenase n=1 Tax=Streptomyces sp. NPDC001787 TaxID=3154523 RepID=UPI00331FB846
MSVPSRTSVLIAGGGPVGLTLSALLSRYGVDHFLVEARPTTSRHPKARGISARSMEIFRRMGLEDAVREAGLPASQVFFYRGRDLVDPDFVRTGLAHRPSDGEPEHTPSPGLICSQDVLEPLLLRHARELAGDRVRSGTRLVSFTDDGRGTDAVVEDVASGSRHRVRADWLVGCDGTGSTVRTGAGIAMEGPTGLGRFLSVRFEAPLGATVADRASASYFLTAPGSGGFMAVDNDRHWIYQHPLAPDAEPAPDLTDRDHLIRLVREAAGIPDLDVTVRDTMTWRMDARLADTYRRSHVLLAGDAAHAIPPTGGHGMNTGIGDADNLAWKLAAVTAGYASEALLDSYGAERRPLARRIIDISTDNARHRTAYRIDDELLLTADYRSTAVLAGPDADAAGPSTLDPTGYHPGCAPGRRAPHVRLTGGEPGTASTLDLIGPGFTLLTTADSPAWRQQAETAARAGIPVVARALVTGTRQEADPGRWDRLCGTPEPRAAVLVRPDGHIAWCASDPGDTPLLPVLRSLLSAP